MNVFDWEEIRIRLQGKQATRDAIIKVAFQQWIDRHSDLDDKSGCELQELFGLFAAGWIICEHITGENQ